VYLLVDPGFLLPPLNFYEASRFVAPNRMDALADTTDKKTRLCPSVRPFVSYTEFDTKQPTLS